jgi:ABC-type multidrug transport system fused ATPase/permease subunit
VVRFGLVLAHIVARAAMIVSALAYERGANEVALCFAAFAAFSWVATRSMTAYARAACEIDLSKNVVHAAFGSDLFARRLRGEFDTLVAGLYDVARFRTQIVPQIVADLIVVAGVVPLVAVRGAGKQFLAFVVGLAIGGAIVVALRRFVWRASVRAWETKQRHLQRVLDGLEGAAELVAARGVERFEARLVETLQASRRAAWTTAVEATFLGRLPLVLGVACAVAFAYVVNRDVVPTQAAAWGILAATLAPFGGIAASAGTFFETRGSVRAVAALVSAPPRHEGDAEPETVTTITTRDLEIAYGDVVALDRVSLVLDKGVTVLAGKNGCGKTTVLRAILGLVPVRGGELVVGGVSHESLRFDAVRADAAFLPQRPYAPVGATVREMMTFAFEADDAACKAALSRAGAMPILLAKGDDPLVVPIDDLSAGERQRVAIARAIIRDVGLYLFDEPDANLDRAGIEHVAELLRELSRSATVIVAAHTPEILALADHFVELDRGRVVRDDGARDEIIARSRSGSRT